MPELFKAIFADLEFTKSDKVKIEYIVILFEFDKRSEKFNKSTK
jgi:hypothetical protein